MTGTHRPRGAALASHIAEVAAELFYQRGINLVGVDAIANAAGITKRTLYRHFASKDNLVVASLSHGPSVNFPPAGEPRKRLLGAFDDLIRFVGAPTYRGCPYINAAAELTNPAHPARKIVENFTTRRRSWFRRRLTEAGVSDAEMLAEQLDLLFDGALANATKRRSTAPAVAARAAAQTLINAALKRR